MRETRINALKYKELLINCLRKRIAALGSVRKLAPFINQRFHTILLVFLLSFSTMVNAGLVSLFKDEQGNTNWQYVANWSSGILILLLLFAFITLLLSHRRTRKANLALEAIRNVLEQRVEQRTATLNESNKLLKESNQLLAGEIEQHRATTNRLRSSEAYIKNILESMPLILIGLNNDMKITQWNRRAEQISGVENQFALNKNLWEVYPTISVAPEQVKAVIDKKMPQTIKHSQRGQYYFDITIYPLRESAETGLVIMIDDVTQRILAENMLIQRDKMSSVGELASTMAYDINAPLQAMIRDIDVVESSITSGNVSGDKSEIDRLETLLSNASDAGKRASRVISNLLAFSSSRGDQKSPEQLPQIIDRAIELAGDVLSTPTGFRFTDIQIKRNYQENLPPLPCYVAELQQVFLSIFRLACNALASTTKLDRNPQIKIEVAERYDALWVKVQHNGAELSNREQQYIFEPFFNNAPDQTDYDMGKRLSFSYFIVTDHHQGQMAVTSDHNFGTTFHMHFQLGRS